MPSGQVMLNVTSGIEQQWLERVHDYGQDIVALWGGARAIAMAPIEEPAILSRMNPEVARGTCRNRFHLEWHRPQGLVDTLAIGLLRDPDNLAAASFVRHERQGLVGPAEIAGVELFAPHLRRAVTISRLLEVQTLRASTFEALLDGLRAAVFLVGDDLQLRHANRAGADMLPTPSAVALLRGRLSFELPVVQLALAAAVRRCVLAEADLGGGGFGLPLPAQGLEARALHVLPLRRGSAREDVSMGAVAAVFVSTGHAPSAIRELAATLYGLSRSEAAVFELMAMGESVAHAAKALGVGVSTVRTHLLRIYEKTGVHRQAELVRLATGLRSPLI